MAGWLGGPLLLLDYAPHGHLLAISKRDLDLVVGLAHSTLDNGSMVNGTYIGVIKDWIKKSIEAQV